MPGLLIADDEEIVRSAIKAIVHRSGVPFDPLLEAGSGEEAVSVARRMRPKILLMDVRMPGLDGLQAARTIRSEDPSSKVIMLTAYDEFSYTQEALRLGAVDYLLKPVRPAALLEVLSRVQAQVEEEQQQQIETEQVTTRLRDTLPLVEARLVHDLVHGGVSSRKASELIATHLGKNITDPVVLFIDVDRFQAATLGMDAEMRDRLCSLLLDIVRRAVPAPQRSLIGPIRPGVIVAILSVEPTRSQPDELRGVAHAIRYAIESGAPLTATIGIGQRVADLSQIPVSYSQASHAAWYKFHFGRNSVIALEDVQGMNRDTRPYPVTMEYELIHRVRLGERQASTELMTRLVDIMLRQLSDPPEVLYTRLMELLALISRAVIDAGASLPDTLERSHGQLMALRERKTASEVRSWALDSLADMMASIPSADHGNQFVERAIALMREKADQPGLELKQIAAAVHISPSHLAHLLKDKTGYSFVQYLTLLRVERARKLLTTTDGTISAIAQAVGYEDPTYFHRIFRRETGMTPSAYRQMRTVEHLGPSVLSAALVAT